MTKKKETNQLDNLISLLSPAAIPYSAPNFLSPSEIYNKGIPIFNIIENLLASYSLLESLHWILNKSLEYDKKTALTNEIFLSTMSYALWLAIIIDLNRLVDKSKGAISFFDIIFAMKKYLRANTHSKEIDKEIEEISALMIILQKNVRKIRNDFFGHNNGKPEKESFERLEKFQAEQNVLMALEIFSKLNLLTNDLTNTCLFGVLKAPDMFINNRHHLTASLIDASLVKQFEGFYAELIVKFKCISGCSTMDLSMEMR